MNLNWRKSIAFGALRLSGSPILDELKVIRSIEFKSPGEIREIENRRLIELLYHAWENTDYYKDILSACGVVRNGKVDLDRFEDIPFLTKNIIRSERARLKAKVLPKGRKSYLNKSGGSTGQPIEFWQDSYYWDMNIASKLYRFEIFGKELGDPEMKVWGSERDLSDGAIGLAAKLKNFIYNRDFQQCFYLPEQRIREIIERINKFKPKIIWAYRDGLDLVANYINHHSLHCHSPAAIFCGGATLYPHIVQSIEKAFKAPVINFYGGREVGDVACQCREKGGLHIAAYSRKVEVISEDGKSVMEEDGELVITNLTSYTMPFIRYQIGDRGKLTAKICPCGRGFPLLESVSGRVTEMLINLKGDHINPLYFIHLFRIVYYPGFVNRFQVIQEDYTRIRIKIVLEPGVSRDQIQIKLYQISDKIRAVMGSDCAVLYDFVDDIPLTKSGKHEYVIRKIPVAA